MTADEALVEDSPEKNGVVLKRQTRRRLEATLQKGLQDNRPEVASLELFSHELSPKAKELGVATLGSMGPLSGWDLYREGDQLEVDRILEVEKPWLVKIAIPDGPLRDLRDPEREQLPTHTDH